MATCNVQTLIKNASCFACLSPGEWEVLELQLLCEILGASAAPATFTSGLFDLSNIDNDIIIPHGLGVTPKFVRVVTVCINGPGEGDLGYATGDEIDAVCWTLGDANYQPTFTIASNSVNIAVHMCNFQNAGGNNVRLNTAQSQDINSYDLVTNWKLKAYAHT